VHSSFLRHTLTWRKLLASGLDRPSVPSTACYLVDGMYNPKADRTGQNKWTLALGWACALAPFMVLLVVFAMINFRQDSWLKAQGVLTNYRLIMLHALDIGWSLSMMFAVYASGPLWILMVCLRRFRRSWRLHAVQLLICGVGWVLFCVLMLRFDLLSKTRL
jgi:hypothetical protein